MVFSVFYFILGFLTFLGIIDLLILILNWLSLPKVFSPKKEKIFVIPLNYHQENIEYIIRSIIYNHKTKFSNCKIKIICIDTGIDKETKKICKLLSKDFSCLQIINSKSEIHH